MVKCIDDLWGIFPDEVRQYVNAEMKSKPEMDTWQACLRGVDLLAQTAETATKYFMDENYDNRNYNCNNTYNTYLD